MSILMFSEYALMVALAVFAIATIRITTRKTIATLLILVNNIYGLSFCRDIATALVLLGPVGTIAFARVLRGD